MIPGKGGEGSTARAGKVTHIVADETGRKRSSAAAALIARGPMDGAEVEHHGIARLQFRREDLVFAVFNIRHVHEDAFPSEGITRPVGDQGYDGKAIACRPVREHLNPQRVVLVQSTAMRPSQVVEAFMGWAAADALSRSS